MFGNLFHLNSQGLGPGELDKKRQAECHVEGISIHDRLSISLTSELFDSRSRSNIPIAPLPLSLPVPRLP